jgi:outer membrane protein assembly factor BamD
MTGPVAGGRREGSAVYSIGEVRPEGRGVARKGVLLLASRRVPVLALVLALLAGLGACGRHKSNLPAPGSMEEDKYLYDRGMELLGQKNWLVAREYFKRLIDTYPQSIYRNDARLGVGDSYIGENRLDSYILAVNEFRMFLQFAPLNQRADYAQYKICLAQSKQMLSSQRDQTATREALADCDAFLKNYPTSRYRTEVEAVRRRARDRLSDYEFGVGLTYFRFKVWSGTESRLRTLIAEDPGYTRLDRAYYYLAEALVRGWGAQRVKEALPLYKRLIEEFPKSEFVKKAQARIAEIEKAGTPPAIKR